MPFFLLSLLFICVTKFSPACAEGIMKPSVAKDFPEPPGIEATTTADGVTWFAIRDFGYRQEGKFLGTGSFLSFQSRNELDRWGDWAYINGGLIDRTAGKEQGDLDLIVYIDGRPAGLALQGRIGPANPALLPTNDGEISLGRPESRFQDLLLSGTIHLPGVACPNPSPGVLKKLQSPPVTCIQLMVDGLPAWVPILR